LCRESGSDILEVLNLWIMDRVERSCFRLQRRVFERGFAKWWKIMKEGGVVVVIDSDGVEVIMMKID